jgi:hypothetical protein
MRIAPPGFAVESCVYEVGDSAEFRFNERGLGSCHAILEVKRPYEIGLVGGEACAKMAPRKIAHR